jgi:hypothetical protein
MKSEPATLNRSNIPPRDEPTFEIGLVLAGAVSGGAYQAGVIDFLMEALERWEEAKESEDAALRDALRHGAEFERHVPRHRVRIRVIAGASAGSISAALIAMRAGLKYPLLTDQEVTAFADKARTPERRVSPLYDAWVRQVDLDSMLSLDDAPEANQKMPSLLNGRTLDAILGKVLTASPPTEEASRRFLCEPLHLAFTACDLDGTAEEIKVTSAGTDIRHRLRSHDHTFRLALYAGARPAANKASDEIEFEARELRELARAGESSSAVHPLFASALASSAFPIGLPPRRVRRMGEAREAAAGTDSDSTRVRSEAPRYVVSRDPRRETSTDVA